MAAAGWIHADARARSRARDCRLAIAEGDSLVVTGAVSGAWSRGVLVDVVEGLPGGCRGELRVTLRGAAAAAGRFEAPAPGVTVEVRGTWASWGDRGDPDAAGELRGEAKVAPAASGRNRKALVRWRESVRLRLAWLFPRRHALVSALVLARKDGVDPGLREAFTRAGVAHLLAISGFHVGVVAIVVLGSLRAVGVRKRPAAVAGTLVVWAYVAFIGAPDAAVRAAILLGLVGAGILRGRPVHRAGALAAAFVLFLVVDPDGLARPGFQLSFMGAAGLVFLGPVVEGMLRSRLRWRRCPSVRSAVAAGVAATLSTLPAVAWHFDEVSLVGIPVTLAATPLVAVAIPGVLAALVADLVPLVPAAAADFLAGGADLLLATLVALVREAGEVGWATAWVPRPLLVVGGVGALAGAALLPPARGVGRDLRLAVSLGGAVGAALLLVPLGTHLSSGALEIVMLDVGQGDAVALRSPRGRWMLFDAGPPPPRGREGPPAAVVELRRRGVRRLEALLLSHPDLDHLGGASAVIDAFRPAVVGGPGHVRGTAAYVEGLETAAARDASWFVLRDGDRLDFDGVRLLVLHPRSDLSPVEDPNTNSLVVHLRFGGFSALFTGDAPAAVEDALAGRAGDVDLLKVAHHGSRTSSSARFLRTVLPEVALVSAGRRNRYGHPHPDVLARLSEVARHVHRTDVERTVRVVARRDGSWSVRSGGWWP